MVYAECYLVNHTVVIGGITDIVGVREPSFRELLDDIIE